MKKILFGLAAMSTLAFSAINLGSPADKTNTWMTGDTGAIAVTGTITSAIPQVQYVIYASTDGNYNADGDTLKLSDFVVSSNALENKFIEENPKVYVKKVNGDKNGAEDLSDSDVVKFKVELEPTRTSYNSSYFGLNGGVTYEATALLTDVVLQDIVNKCVEMDASSGATYGFEAGRGVLTNSGKTYFYSIKNGIRFESKEQGVLQVIASQAPCANESSKLEAQIKTIETVLSSGKQITNVKILATVNL